MKSFGMTPKDHLHHVRGEASCLNRSFRLLHGFLPHPLPNDHQFLNGPLLWYRVSSTYVSLNKSRECLLRPPQIHLSMIAVSSSDRPLLATICASPRTFLTSGSVEALHLFVSMMNNHVLALFDPTTSLDGDPNNRRALRDLDQNDWKERAPSPLKRFLFSL
jgi:hypothetical protein